MSETLLNEIRATRPEAPSALRERVRSLSVREPVREPLLDRLRFTWGWRRLVLVAPATMIVALLAAGVIGLTQDDLGSRDEAAPTALQTFGEDAAPSEAAQSEAAPPSTRALAPTAKDAGAAGGTVAPSPGQLQRFEAELSLRVDDVEALSNATKQAQQIARSHDGSVSSLQYDAPSRGGRDGPDHAADPDRAGRERAGGAVAARDDRRPALRDPGPAAAGRQPADADRADTAPDRPDPRPAREPVPLGREPRRPPVAADVEPPEAHRAPRGDEEHPRRGRHLDGLRVADDRGDPGGAGRREPPRRRQGRARLGGDRGALRARRRRPVRDRRHRASGS